MKLSRSGIKIRCSKGDTKCIAQWRSGFTLVEMMVTLAIMMLLFGIIFVPLNQAFNFFQLGQTRTSMQQAARQSLEQISSDLRTAVRMFPNDVTPGITNQSPYNNNGGPYIEVKDPVAANSCSNEVLRRSNLSRIDFIPAQLDGDGSVIIPVRPARYLVTYYARRLNPAKEYDAVENPVILHRAQSPIYNGDGSPAETSNGKTNVDTSSGRYSSGCDNRASAWLMQRRGEPNFDSPLPGDDPIVSDSDPNKAPTVPGSHTRAIPLGVSLTAPLANLAVSDPDLSYTPLTTFTLTDANNDGKFDQVKINLALESHNTASTSNSNGEMPKPQIVRMSTTVDLPNVM
jgi:prepilin-type N-terminal cleavage/methylation domain-containing protein